MLDRPPHLPLPTFGPYDANAQRAYLDMSFIGDDPLLISQAIKEVATLRGLPCALGANPQLGELLRALRELGFTLSVSRLASLDQDQGESHLSLNDGPFADLTACEGMEEPSGSVAPYALVVDDNATVRMVAMEILEDAGFQTFGAVDGDEAVAVLAEHHAFVTLLFTDVEMPGGVDGFELARVTAQLYPQIQIVVASGATQPELGDMPAGARFIGKPFSAELVHAHLREILPDGQKPKPLKG